jgi:erythromycin esterase
MARQKVVNNAGPRKSSSQSIVEGLRRSVAIFDQSGAVSESALGTWSTALRSVQVIGFGESTHGAREFYRLRHRLLRHLVEHLGFRLLALEAPYSGAQALNAFVLGGDGDCASALKRLASTMWNVDEFADVVQWLRNHNAAVAPKERVQIVGLGMYHTRPSREVVLTYLRRGDREDLARAERLFAAVDAAEARGLLRWRDGLQPELFNLADELASQLARTPRSQEAAAAAFSLQLIVQWLAINLSDCPQARLPPQIPKVAGLNNFARSRYLAENLRLALDRSMRAKAIVWTHNFHVGVGAETHGSGLAPTMGSWLRDWWGPAYYALGLEFGQGSYRARDLQADRSFGDLVVGVVGPPAVGTLPEVLARAADRATLCDFRRPGSSLAYRRWLKDPIAMHSVGWARAEQTPYTRVRLGVTFDGLLFAPIVSPTTPTTSAQEAVALRAYD